MNEYSDLLNHPEHPIITRIFDQSDIDVSNTLNVENEGLRDDIYYLKYHNELNYLILNYLIFEGYESSVLEFARCLRLNFIIDELNNQVSDPTSENFNDGGQPDDAIDYIEDDDDLDIGFEVDEFFTPQMIEDNINSSYDKLMKGRNKDVIALSPDKIKRLTFGLSSIKIRNEIKLLILKGDIKQVIDLINSRFPTLFEKNQFIYFKLLHLNLIEIIRNHFEKDDLSNDDSERLFLDNVLSFIKEKLSTIKILQNENFIKELELTMALLCFGNSFKNNKVKVPTKLRSLIDKKLRKDICKLVNKSILINLNNEDLSNLTNDLKYNDYYSFKMLDKSKVPHDTTTSSSTSGRGEIPSIVKDGIEDQNNDTPQNDDGIVSKDELSNKFEEIGSIKLNSLLKLWVYSNYLNGGEGKNGHKNNEEFDKYISELVM